MPGELRDGTGIQCHECGHRLVDGVTRNMHCWLYEDGHDDSGIEERLGREWTDGHTQFNV